MERTVHIYKNIKLNNITYLSCFQCSRKIWLRHEKKNKLQFFGRRQTMEQVWGDKPGGRLEGKRKSNTLFFLSLLF